MCGSEGKNWIARYDEAKGWDMAARLDHIVALCRRNRVEEARRLLASCLADLQAAERNAPPSVTEVIRRWYLSTEAYVCYHCGEYQQAWSLLERSTAAIRASIVHAPFLIGLAAGCVEFAVHYARLSRFERRWSDMKRYFALARGMYQDRLPLCELADGSPIFVGHIYRFVATLTPDNDEERASLAFICNPDVLGRGVEILIRRVEAATNMVIPFE
jgi:hypothetical protein